MISHNEGTFISFFKGRRIIHGFPLPAQKDNEKRKIVKTP